MPTRADLLANVRDKLKDAELLYKAKRYDHSYYLCGFAIELALKARIVKHLGWSEFPDDEHKCYGLAVHDLNKLLQFTGIGHKIKSDSDLFARWSVVAHKDTGWKPRVRYQRGHTTKPEAREMLEHAKKLTDAIKK